MEDDQQFCLRWNNHQSTLIAVFDTLLEKGIHVDCTLAAEGQTLKAHKVVLSACSPYFESVLLQQYDKHPIIILKDVKFAELRAMMDYMYRGEVNISQDQLAALLKAAESLQIKGLSDNKPSRPSSLPAPVPVNNAHPPRTLSPQRQVRDSSVESREGSASPTRRRKKARRTSTDLTPAAVVPASGPVPEPPVIADDTPPLKEETTRDGVEDLTLDEEAEEPPATSHNDVVRNFQWHMERSQDEMMNSNDSVRDSQEQDPPLSSYKTLRPFMPLTRGLLRNISYFINNNDNGNIKRRKNKPNILRAQKEITKTPKKRGRKKKIYTDSDLEPLLPANKLKSESCDRSTKKHECSICHKRTYKHKRNKLRHEKYECSTGPQFGCTLCGRKYSQNKTLKNHIIAKHSAEDKPSKYSTQESQSA